MPFPVRASKVLRIFLLPLFTGALAASTFNYTGAGGDFSVATFDMNGNPVTGTTTYTIPVSDFAIIDVGDSVTVTLTGLQYPYASDLQVSLSLYNSANNLLASGDLFNQVCITNSSACPDNPTGDTQFGGNYSFNSSYTGDFWSTVDGLGSSDMIPTGQYWTSTAGSPGNDNVSGIFSGLSINGTWVLTVNDYYPPFNGGPALYNPGILSWGLAIEATGASTTPEPATALLFALPIVLLWVACFTNSTLPARRLPAGK